ncbi:hypothetical protein [Methanonatronarchaeum sp. AMET6-2]|uniref:hypothetical protein n=1 Tax=Methanonatronarchaeum sp. AMET6-2 TaxID=2933293 RepID=UPI0011FE21A4|nr:hypothetical protein [Methanonatronarchaeum sp. AMET6-2]RZN60976.1 MAG: hypothetical protein EF811_05695 [Methanonatronarchaeia archaeon]UOY10669.1 hypothetical protein MU439_03260 [Methanonatronarchaeum sp. AMET6-2]
MKLKPLGIWAVGVIAFLSALYLFLEGATEQQLTALQTIIYIIIAAIGLMLIQRGRKLKKNK